MNPVLVTGASGFVGGHLVRSLAMQGFDVVGVFLVACANVDGAASLLERWLATPVPHLERMRANAVRSFSERFELQRFAQGFIECLRTP